MDRDLHLSGVSLQGIRLPDHQLPSARVHADHAGICAGGKRTCTGRVRRGGKRTVPVLQLRRRDADPVTCKWGRRPFAKVYVPICILPCTFLAFGVYPMRRILSRHGPGIRCLLRLPSHRGSAWRAGEGRYLWCLAAPGCWRCSPVWSRLPYPSGWQRSVRARLLPRQRSRNMAVEMPSVQYFWLALYLITMPSPRYGRLDGSALSG